MSERDEWVREYMRRVEDVVLAAQVPDRDLDVAVAALTDHVLSTPAAAPDALREALSWALDMIDMYDERLAGIDGRERVYSTVHLAGKAKARAALATAPAAEPPAPVMTVEKLRAHIEDVLHEWAKTALWYERIVTEDGVAPKAIREKRNAIYESAIECCIDRLVALSSAGDNTKRTSNPNERASAEAKRTNAGAAAPTPEALRAWGEWFDNPNASPVIAVTVAVGTRRTGGFVCRALADALERALASSPETPRTT